MSDQDRRKFLGTAAGVAAFTILPRHVLGGPGYVAPSDKITLALHRRGHRGTPRDAAPALRPRNPDRRRLRPQQACQWISRLVRQRHPQLRSAGLLASRTGGPAPRAPFPAAAIAPKTSSRPTTPPAASTSSGCAAYADFRELLRKGKGRGRRQNHDARPSPRRHRHGRHEARQAHHRPQAHRQSPEGSPHGHRYRPLQRRGHALHAVGRQRQYGAGDGVDQGRRHRHACAKSTTGPTARCGRSTPPSPPIRRRCRRASIGTCGWDPKRSAPIIPTTPTWCSAAGTISAADPWPIWGTTACGPSSTRWSCPAPPASSPCSATIARSPKASPPPSRTISRSPPPAWSASDIPRAGNGRPIDLIWYEGGMRPPTPEELDEDHQGTAARRHDVRRRQGQNPGRIPRR